MKNMKNIRQLIAVAVATTLATGALLAAEPEKKPEWLISAGMSFTLTSGNTETVLFGADLNAVKKAKENEYLLGIAGAYGESQGDKNNELIRGFAQWNHLFNERFYGFLRGEGLHDGIALIRYRITAAGGAGYYLVKEKRTTLAVEAAPGYVYEKRASGLNNYMTVRLAERFELKLNDTARVWQSLEYLPSVENWVKDYVLSLELGIEAAITKKLSLRSVLTDSYDSTPGGRKHNDLKVTSGVVYKF